MNRYIIPIFIPHVGCPHDCSFCNQKRIAGTTKEVTEEEVSAIIKSYLSTLPQNNVIREIAFYGGSFTGLPLQQQKQLLRPATIAKDNGLINEIRVSTRPDYINGDILENLKNMGITTIELGVQSTNDNVLRVNLRGHTRGDVEAAVNAIKAFDIQLGLQMMLGLPGDSATTFMETVRDFINWQPDFVRIYPTIVIKDTHLADLYNSGEYIPMDLDEAVALGKEALEAFTRAAIPVIRMGLQSTDEITYGVGIVAGPYHPAYRELVESEIFRDKIQMEIDKLSQVSFKEIVVYCNKRDASKVAGYRKSNKEFFIEKYKLRAFKIKAADDIVEGNLRISVN